MSAFTTYYRMPLALILAIMLVSGCSDQDATTPPVSKSTNATSAEQYEPAEAPAPTTQAPVTAQSATVAQATDGKKTYKTFCQACHANGVAGAPKSGDKEAWAPRIAKGNDALFLSVKKGLKAMPPKGACMSCSDDDLRAAMEYLVEQGS